MWIGQIIFFVTILDPEYYFPHPKSPPNVLNVEEASPALNIVMFTYVYIFSVLPELAPTALLVSIIILISIIYYLLSIIYYLLSIIYYLLSIIYDL